MERHQADTAQSKMRVGTTKGRRKRTIVFRLQAKYSNAARNAQPPNCRCVELPLSDKSLEMKRFQVPTLRSGWANETNDSNWGGWTYNR
jgi:hypothetical protein